MLPLWRNLVTGYTLEVDKIGNSAVTCNEIFKFLFPFSVYKLQRNCRIVSLCNMGYPSSERILNSNLTKTPLSITYFTIAQSFWNFAERGSVAAEFCTKNQNDWIKNTNVMGEREFAIFDFKMSFEWRSYIVQPHSLLQMHASLDLTDWNQSSNPIVSHIRFYM